MFFLFLGLRSLGGIFQGFIGFFSYGLLAFWVMSLCLALLKLLRDFVYFFLAS